uniref:Uncharacterized protein n=1 Tax=Anguilla anguilla TaxID=7936 RepID=A0A0E9QRC3_ANGAN
MVSITTSKLQRFSSRDIALSSSETPAYLQAIHLGRSCNQYTTSWSRNGGLDGTLSKEMKGIYSLLF